MTKVKRIRWHHDGDTCEAEVGGPVRWATPNSRTGRLGPWRTEGTVAVIEPPGQTCWLVHFEPGSQPRGPHWNQPIMCGNNVEILETEPDEQ